MHCPWRWSRRPWTCSFDASAEQSGSSWRGSKPESKAVMATGKAGLEIDWDLTEWVGGWVGE